MNNSNLLIFTLRFSKFPACLKLLLPMFIADVIYQGSPHSVTQRFYWVNISPPEYFTPEDAIIIVEFGNSHTYCKIEKV